MTMNLVSVLTLPLNNQSSYSPSTQNQPTMVPYCSGINEGLFCLPNIGSILPPSLLLTLTHTHTHTHTRTHTHTHTHTPTHTHTHTHTYTHTHTHTHTQV